jgi:hypothetical protein
MIFEPTVQEAAENLLNKRPNGKLTFMTFMCSDNSKWTQPSEKGICRLYAATHAA